MHIMPLHTQPFAMHTKELHTKPFAYYGMYTSPHALAP